MKLAELAKELHITTDSFIKFIQDFDLELSECISTDFEVKEDFARFARENISFLKNYQKDLEQPKTVEDIAGNISQPADKVAEVIRKEKPAIYENGVYRSSVSSFGVDQKLGGDYNFVYNYFGKRMPLAKRDFIGYRDLFFYISKALDPFANENTTLTDWGIHRPAGIILYGPPGSGKIFWAHKIAQIIGYQFKEIKKYYLGTSFVDGNETSFNDFLLETMKQEKVVLFMDDFDNVMMERTATNSVASCDEETKEIILHHIDRFEEEELLMVASANTLTGIDREILAPGRFDVVIPVFPPNVQERAEIILYYMTKDLSDEALLKQVLEKNNADHLPFWNEISARMKVFSNTMLIDFTQSLKKRIRTQYLKDNSLDIDIKKHLQPALREASAKLTDEYFEQMSRFIKDISVNNYDDFATRIENLKQELQHYRIVEKPRQAIGFTHNSDSK